jgi:hypothetical protein
MDKAALRVSSAVSTFSTALLVASDMNIVAPLYLVTLYDQDCLLVNFVALRYLFTLYGWDVSYLLTTYG